MAKENSFKSQFQIQARADPAPEVKKPMKPTAISSEATNNNKVDSSFEDEW